VVKDLCEAEEGRKDRDVYPGIFNVAYLTEERAIYKGRKGLI